MIDWKTTLRKFKFEKKNVDVVFLDEIQFMNTADTLLNIEIILNKGIDVVCAGLDQDSRGKPWETSSMLLGLSDKILKFMDFVMFVELKLQKHIEKKKVEKELRLAQQTSMSLDVLNTGSLDN